MAGEKALNARDPSGKTPLHLAAESGHRDMVQILVDAGADIDAEDEESTTPMMAAEENGPRDVSDIILERGPKRPFHVTPFSIVLEDGTRHEGEVRGPPIGEHELKQMIESGVEGEEETPFA